MRLTYCRSSQKAAARVVTRGRDESASANQEQENDEMAKKPVLTLRDIQQLRDKASKEVLAIIRQLESETGLTIASISDYQTNGWTTEISIDLEYES